MAVLSGFTYNGVHSEEFGLYYLPTEEDRWFLDPEYEVYSTDIEWKHGGIYYDSKATIRTFTLNCFFENIDVAKRQAIKAWLKRGTSGKLIFDEMPFVYWMVRPGKIPVGNWYYDQDTYSGTVVITFNAYEPFGYLTRKSNYGDENDNAADYCNLIDEADMPAAPVAPWEVQRSGNEYTFDVYNPGTETCGLTIEIKGYTENQIRFYNETNDTFCIFNGLSTNRKKGMVSSDKYLVINGDTGLVYVKDDYDMYPNFYFHDKGIVRLEPNIGKSNIAFINGVYDDIAGECALDLVGYHVTNALVGASVTFHDQTLEDVTLTITSVNSPNNRIYCAVPDEQVPATKNTRSNEESEFPQTGNISIKNVNTIRVEEAFNSSPRGVRYAEIGWVTPFTLEIESLKVDYAPRLM